MGDTTIPLKITPFDISLPPKQNFLWLYDDDVSVIQSTASEWGCRLFPTDREENQKKMTLYLWWLSSSLLRNWRPIYSYVGKQEFKKNIYVDVVAIECSRNFQAK